MHVFFVREAWRSFKQHRGLGMTAIFSLTAALTLSGLFVLLSHNADNALRYVGDRREMVVYLKDDMTESRVALSSLTRSTAPPPT
jgi:cell division protein FtsX